MSVNREQFNSRFGFIMAATGSAVGLGNIWGFPTQTASNGGGAFVLVYLILTFCLAYPAFMAELLIGRHSKANIVDSLKNISIGTKTRSLASITGFMGVLVSSLILSFYIIVAGWVLGFMVQPIVAISGFDDAARWLTNDLSGNNDGALRNIALTLMFMLFTMQIIRDGVKNGIEKWASRLMPAIFILLISLIIYVLTLEGASDGLSHYLVPDFTQITNPGLLISALVLLCHI